MDTIRVSELIILLAITYVHSIPIPNGLIGIPEVECGEDTIIVVFNTENPFEGVVFAKGFAEDEKCASKETGRKTTSIEIRKEDCGITVLRSADPPGLFVNVKMVISFHNQFITKVDRGFDIQCFYMQTTKTVTYPITVSAKPLDELQEIAEMPRCQYEVFLGGPEGPPAETVEVGEALYHKWTCESSTPSIWCMSVYDCKVDDGKGNQIQILNEEGCAVDKYILQNLEYQTALMAGQESHAFKFADEVVVNFLCSIRIDIRDEDGGCQRPECPALRAKRALPSNSSTTKIKVTLDDVYRRPAIAETDVKSQEIDVFDLSLTAKGLSNAPEFRNGRRRNREAATMCINPVHLYIFGFTFLVVLTSLVITCTIACMNRQKLLALEGKS